MPNSVLNSHKWPSKCVKIVYHTFCRWHNITIFFRKSKSLNDFAKIKLSKIADWFKANKLTLNASETSYTFQKENKSPVCESWKLFIENKEIDRIGAGGKNESFKFVGIQLNENLNHHLKAFRNKASSAVFALSNM